MQLLSPERVTTIATIGTGTIGALIDNKFGED